MNVGQNPTQTDKTPPAHYSDCLQSVIFNFEKLKHLILTSIIHNNSYFKNYNAKPSLIYRFTCAKEEWVLSAL